MNYEMKGPKIQPCGTLSRTNAFGNLISLYFSKFDMGMAEISITQIHFTDLKLLRVQIAINSISDKKVSVYNKSNINECTFF